MTKYLPVILTVLASIAAAVGLPNLVHSHLGIYAGLVAAAQILHAVLPSVFGLGNGQ